MTSPKFVRNVLFCDDVRTERNGKDIAIGIYNGVVNVSQTPFIMQSFCVRIEFDFHGEETTSCNVSMHDPLSNRMFNETVSVSFIDWHRPGAVTLNFGGMIFPVPGEYKFKVAAGNAENETTLRVDIIDHVKVRERAQEMSRRIAEQAAR